MRRLLIIFFAVFSFVAGFALFAVDNGGAITNGTFPAHGQYFMSKPSGYLGKVTVGSTRCSEYLSGIKKARGVIQSSTRNEPELDRYTVGIRHNIYCGITETPPSGGEYDACGQGNSPWCGFQNYSTFNNSNTWATYLWWDPEQEGFKQSNGTYIGGRHRKRAASAAYCAFWAAQSSCGNRSLLQLNSTKYPPNPVNAVRNLLIHELGHPQGLADQSNGSLPISAMNYAHYTHYWTLYDRDDINTVYNLQTGCSVTITRDQGHRGGAKEYGDGTHNNLGNLNNKVSAMRIHGGTDCQVVVCDGSYGSGYGWGCQGYLGGPAYINFNGQYNDSISALRVVTL